MPGTTAGDVPLPGAGAGTPGAKAGPDAGPE